MLVGMSELVFGVRWIIGVVYERNGERRKDYGVQKEFTEGWVGRIFDS